MGRNSLCFHLLVLNNKRRFRAAAKQLDTFADFVPHGIRSAGESEAGLRSGESRQEECSYDTCRELEEIEKEGVTLIGLPCLL